jgi:hypothetical protein
MIHDSLNNKNGSYFKYSKYDTFWKCIKVRVNDSYSNNPIEADGSSCDPECVDRYVPPMRQMLPVLHGFAMHGHCSAEAVSSP